VASPGPEEEEEEEEDLFVFNDTIEGPRAPAGASASQRELRRRPTYEHLAQTRAWRCGGELVVQATAGWEASRWAPWTLRAHAIFRKTSFSENCMRP